jgi:hypothetical protein
VVICYLLEPLGHLHLQREWVANSFCRQ